MYNEGRNKKAIHNKEVHKLLENMSEEKFDKMLDNSIEIVGKAVGVIGTIFVLVKIIQFFM